MYLVNKLKNSEATNSSSLLCMKMRVQLAKKSYNVLKRFYLLSLFGCCFYLTQRSLEEGNRIPLDWLVNRNIVLLDT